MSRVTCSARALLSPLSHASFSEQVRNILSTQHTRPTQPDEITNDEITMTVAISKDRLPTFWAGLLSCRGVYICTQLRTEVLCSRRIFRKICYESRDMSRRRVCRG